MPDRFKFRTWNVEENRYIYGLQNSGYFTVAIYDDDFIVEQCTGCRDCNNQLIYEGDILEIAEDMGISYVVVYWDNEFQKWAIEGDIEGDYEFYDLVKRPCDNAVIDDVGIVGNIHENADLLED